MGKTYRDKKLYQDRVSDEFQQRGKRGKRYRMYFDLANKQLRNDTVKKIREGNFDDIVARPKNMDWIID